MHELSMAQAIVDTIMDVAEKNNAEGIVEVTIEIGMLTMLNSEQLTFLLDVLAEGTILENAKIIIEDVPVEINCRNCQYKGLANTDGSDHYLAMVLCPECGGRDVETITGKECAVKKIKIEKSDEDA